MEGKGRSITKGKRVCVGEGNGVYISLLRGYFVGMRETPMFPHSAPKSILTTTIKSLSNQIDQYYSTTDWFEVNVINTYIN